MVAESTSPAEAGRLPWRAQAFRLTTAACIGFVLLTFVAMALYPGGTGDDPAREGYSFFANFFSDLGITESHSGEGNVAAAALFFVALSAAGAGLVLFFVAIPHLLRRRRSAYILALIGSLFGVLSGLAYIGVAFTPANLLLEAHVQAVLLAFTTFPVATLLYTVAILRDPAYPRRYAAVFLAFTVLLGGYAWLLFNGPRDGANALVVQATGQKVIVYAAIVAMSIQSWGAYRVMLKRLGAGD
jgi:hypothetical protein